MKKRTKKRREPTPLALSRARCADLEKQVTELKAENHAFRQAGQGVYEYTVINRDYRWPQHWLTKTWNYK